MYICKHTLNKSIVKTCLYGNIFLKRDKTFADKQAKEEDKETSADRCARRNIGLRISPESQRTSNKPDHQRLHVSSAHASLRWLRLLIFLFSLLFFFLWLPSLSHHVYVSLMRWKESGCDSVMWVWLCFVICNLKLMMETNMVFWGLLGVLFIDR